MSPFDVHFLSFGGLYSVQLYRNPIEFFFGHMFLIQFPTILPPPSSFHTTLFTISATRSIQIPCYVLDSFCVSCFASALLFTYSAGSKLVHLILLILSRFDLVSLVLQQKRLFGVSCSGFYLQKFLLSFPWVAIVVTLAPCSDLYFLFFVVLITLYHFFDSHPRVERALDSVSSVMHFFYRRPKSECCRLICFMFWMDPSYGK